MKIRVEYTVDLEPADVELLLAYAQGFVDDERHRMKERLRRLFKQEGLQAVELAREAAEEERLSLVAMKGGRPW